MGLSIPLDDPITVGRSSKADVVVEGSGVSGLHARFVRLDDDDHVVQVEDLNSRNGTFVNGARVEQSPMAMTDTVRLGSTVTMRLSPHEPLDESTHERHRLETIGRMSLGLVHDFNNVLAVVKANLDFLRTTPDGPPATEEAIDDALLALARGSDLSKRLLSAVASGPREHRVVNLTDLCNEVVTITRRTFPKAIETTDDIEERLYVFGDGAALRQVLMNLCVNARDAMATGGGIMVRAQRRHPVETLKVELTVSDTGEGMDEETCANAFEPFFTTKREGRGFGIGLANCAEIVAAHGGTIDVQSRVGAGTMFTVTLPLVRERVGDTLDTPLHTPAPTRTAGHRLMLVDDDQTVRRSFGRLLIQAGYEVHEASNGGSALDTAKRLSPAIAVVDLDMPGMSGEDTCRSLRELDPKMAILVMTGTCDEETECQLLTAGVTVVIRKPAGRDDLLTAIADATEDRSVADPHARAQLAAIFERNGGRCTYCDLPLMFRQRGERASASRGGWAVDRWVACDSSPDDDLWPACLKCIRDKGKSTGTEYIRRRWAQLHHVPRRWLEMLGLEDDTTPLSEP